MATVRLSPQALADVERLAQFLALTDPIEAARTVGLIVEGVLILEQHPLIGRRARNDRRELVISRGSTGYVALYRYRESSETITVMAIRHQREVGHGD